jgi:glycosyltransferase involved in cell wall biosynthesis
MIYIALFVFIFTAIQFIVSLINLFCAEKMLKSTDQNSKLVSVLIPARNEEKNIDTLVQDILNQPYQNFELIICDDQSDDRTADIVCGYSQQDERIKLINIKKLPPGWLGKNYACYTLSKYAGGDYLLFLDADVRIKGDIILRTISHSEKYCLGLISIFPKQIMCSWGEKSTVPVMNYILLTLLPLILVRRSKFKSLSAANGQFMFFKAPLYRDINPHEYVKSNKVEDIAIARLFKSKKIRVSCQTGDESVTCRMYNNLRDAVNGFSKNVIAFFGNSFILALLFWFISTLGFIFVILNLRPVFSAAYILMYVLTKICVSISSRQNIPENILLIIPQQIFLGMFICNFLINKFKNRQQWKGRNIYY